MSIILLRFALLCYGVGFLVTFVPLLTGGRRAVNVTPWLAGVGAVAHTAAVVALGFQLGRCPLATLPEVLSALAWAAVLVYLVVWWRYRVEVLNIIVLPLVMVVLIVSRALPQGLIPIAPSLQPSLLRFHLTAIVLGVAALFITFAASLVYFLLDSALKAKRPARFFLSLPSLERCDRVGRVSLLWAFPILTIGIVTGAIAQASVAGTFWSWQPRENLAVIAWLILGVVLVARLGWGWRGRKAAILTILGFATLFLRMLGV